MCNNKKKYGLGNNPAQGRGWYVYDYASRTRISRIFRYKSEAMAHLKILLEENELNNNQLSP